MGASCRKKWLYMVKVILLMNFSILPLVASERLTWAVMDLPPRYILAGENKGKGIADQQLHIYQEQMPEYEFEFIEMNFSRIVKNMKNGSSLCTAALFKTPEREAFMHFSIANDLLLPEAIYIRKKDWEQFGQVAALSLKSFLSGASLKGGVQRGRTYTKEVDLILQKHEQIHRVSRSAQLLTMLIRERLDFVLEAPLTMGYLMNDEAKAQLTSMYILEYQPYVNIYVACTKNSQGFKVITQINEILQRQRPLAQYRKIVEQWIPLKDRKHFRKLYNKELLSIIR